MKRLPRVVIVEDHPMVGQGLRALLEPTCHVVGLVQDARGVEAAITKHQPDLLLLDLSMPHRNGFEVLAAVRKRFPSLRVLVVTMHLDRKVANLAFRTGAHGFVPKESSARELNVAITQVLEGNKYLSPRVSRRGYRDANVDVNPALDRLTPRQKEILRLLGRGKSSPAIAAELDVSVRTVEFHRAGIRRALGITSEWGLMRFAIMADLGSGAERR